MLNLCPPQQTGFTSTVNCSVAQNCCSEPEISCRISLEPKDTAYQNDSLTLQQGGFHVRHLYLFCHYVKQRQVSCGLTQGSGRCSCEQGSAHLTSCAAVCKMPCSSLPALPSAPCREHPAPPFSSPPGHDAGQGTGHWLRESRGSKEAEASHRGQHAADWEPRVRPAGTAWELLLN